MSDNTRKYCLYVGDTISCGISSKTTADGYNLLNQFSVNNCNYEEITSTELSILNHPEYLKRVCDFLSYLDIEDTNTRENLIESASYYDPNCEIICDLNSNFLVYKFLDGVRIIDIGEVEGEAQYRAYPEGEDPSEYMWQITPTLFNLDMTKTYIFEIRDIVNNEEFCRVQKTISIPTLVQSTTFIPEEKLVYINSDISSGEGIHGNGTVEIEPSLKNNEMVSIDYKLSSIGEYDGESCIQLYCKPKNGQDYHKICRHTSDDGDGFGSIDLYNGDQLCYNITNTPTTGTYTCSSFEIISTDGMGTTSPLIDVSRCLVYREYSLPPEEIVMSINTISVNDERHSKTESGLFTFSPDIPMNQCYIFKLSGLTTAESITDDRSLIPPDNNNRAFIKLYCKSNNDSNYVNILSHYLDDPQPLITGKPLSNNGLVQNPDDGFIENPNIHVRYGDSICYDIGVMVDDGFIVSSTFSVIKSTGSYGINSTIGLPNTASVSKIVSPDARMVSMCTQNSQIGESQSIGDGYINIDKPLENDEKIKINFNSSLSISSNTDQTDNEACAIIYCRKAGYNDFVVKCEMTAQTTGDNYFGDLTITEGDKLCYKLIANTGRDSTVSSILSLDDVEGIGGIYAYLNSNEDKRCDSVSASSYELEDPFR